jgi:hypothetical protein
VSTFNLLTRNADNGFFQTGDNGSESQSGTEPATESGAYNGKIINTKTTEELLSQYPSEMDKISSLSTTEDLLLSSQTTAERLSSMPGLIDKIDLKRDFSFDKSLYSNEGKSIRVGHLDFDYKAPINELDTEKLKLSASLGSVSGEITALDLNPSFELGDIAKADARYRIGTINAHANGEVKFQIDGLNLNKSGFSAKASTGAEAMVWDAKYSIDLNITPKSIGDALGGVYNNYVDPFVDALSGEDIPEIPLVPDYLDHGVVFSGHASIGSGISGKLGGEFNMGNGKPTKMGYHVKGGIGAVFGHGFSLGFK